MGPVLIFLGSIVAFVIILLIVFSCRNSRYTKFVEENSKSLDLLDELNERYHFYKKRNFDLEYTYDSDVNYNNVSCKDYLIYNLQFKKKDILENIRQIEYNSNKLPLYLEEIHQIKHMGSYKVDPGKMNKNKLISIENKLFDSYTRKPFTVFTIYVRLIYRDMAGRYKESKYCTFTSENVLNYIEKLNNRNGTFYKDRDIWDAICRVERGKVSNRMRFSIYERDNYRCRYCHRSCRFADLEIDHIKPIAKGGKSTYDNLQTLCRRCNKEKGTDYYE